MVILLFSAKGFPSMVFQLLISGIDLVITGSLAKLFIPDAKKR
jgi:hypothetical protein